MAIFLAKKNLRESIKSIIKTIDKEEKIRQGEKVFQKLISLPQYNEGKRVSLFLSTDDEIDTKRILKDLFEKQKEVFVPRYGGSKMQMVKLHSMNDYENLPVTSWNIKQPHKNDKREDALETGGLDLIIVPGVAFSRKGKRLGHGGGYYDAYLRNITKIQERKPHLVAVGFNEQICEEIPTNESDYDLDLVLTAN